MRTLFDVHHALAEAREALPRVARHRQGAARRLIGAAEAWVRGDLSTEDVELAYDADAVQFCHQPTPQTDIQRERGKALRACQNPCWQIHMLELERRIRDAQLMELAHA